MPCCAVFGCGNYNVKTKGTEIKYFGFPKSEISKQWVVFCNRADKINLKTACICSIHFHPSCFEVSLKHRLLNYNPKNCRNLTCDAVPTLNRPYSLVSEDGLHKWSIKKEPSQIIETLFIDVAVAAQNDDKIQDYNIQKDEFTSDKNNIYEEVSIKKENYEQVDEVVPEYNNSEDVSIKTHNDQLERELRELREKVKKLETANSGLSRQLKLQHDNQRRDVEKILGVSLNMSHLDLEASTISAFLYENELNKEVPEWLQFIPRSNFLCPNDQLYEAALILNKEFESKHENTLSRTNLYLLGQQTIVN